MLKNILPANPITDKLEAAIGRDITNLYFIGHNARNFIYGFEKEDKGYQFILSTDGMLPSHIMLAAESIEGFQRDEGNLHDIYVKNAKFDVKITAKPIDTYLLSSAFAGDGVAIHVLSGRLIVLPEYLTCNPIQQIRAERAPGLPENPMLYGTKDAREWCQNHKNKLQKFQENVTELAQRINPLMQANEPNQQN